MWSLCSPGREHQVLGYEHSVLRIFVARNLTTRATRRRIGHLGCGCAQRSLLARQPPLVVHA